MAAITRVFGWIGRKGLVFLLLVAALVGHQLLSASYVSYDELRGSVVALREGGASLASFSREGIDRSNASVSMAHRLTRGQIIDRRARAQVKLEERASDCRADLGVMLTKGASGVIENRRRCIEVALLTREIDTLNELETTLDARRPGETIAAAVARHRATSSRARAVHTDAVAKINAYDDVLFTRLRYRIEKPFQIARRERAKAAYAAATRNEKVLVTAHQGIARVAAGASTAVADTRASFDQLVGARSKLLGSNGVEQARGLAERVSLTGKLVTAAWLLAGIIASPYLVRLLCWFVLAPIAMRRPAIRLLVPGDGAAVPLADRSTTSVGVRLASGEELLVRQDYLQTSSGAGDKATQWFLDWRHPFSSIASGLVFLTRLRGGDALTTVSAVRDPFAEVTVLTIPKGAACVLHPRGIAAVAQPIGRPMRIASHWRLGSLHAWLTLQLRFLVFHGPARVVIKGGRGVRVEPATQGRVFGQDQLVGFSADLGYTITRTETFWPYLFGRESLFKDRITDGDGVLIVEEAPFAGRNGKPRRGLEGAIDAGLKVFGL